QNLQKLEAGHWAMQLGKRLGQAPKTQSPEAMQLFKAIDLHLDAILVQGRVLVTNFKEASAQQLEPVAQKLVGDLKIYRTGLGNVMNLYDEEFATSIFHFKLAEIFVLGGLLTILSVSFWFFFRPAVNNVQAMM